MQTKLKIMNKDYIKEEKSMDLSALRERLLADNEQKIWDEAREKFTPRKLQDVPLEELKEWFDKMCDNARSHHPELSYSEWYLMCMRNEIYIRQQLGYTDDTTTWDVLNDIRNEIKKKEEYKKWHPYEPLEYQQIAKCVELDSYITGVGYLEKMSLFWDRVDKELMPIEKMESLGTDDMTPKEILKVARELQDVRRELSLLPDLDRNFEYLKLYRQHLIKYHLKDVLADRLNLRSAIEDLAHQLRRIGIHRETIAEFGELDDDDPELKKLEDD